MEERTASKPIKSVKGLMQILLGLDDTTKVRDESDEPLLVEFHKSRTGKVKKIALIARPVQR